MFHSTRKHHRRKAYKSSIDLDKLRAIPILHVAQALGMELMRTGSGLWNMRDPGNPREAASLTIFEKTNSWYRFSGRSDGGVSGGSQIDLVIHMQECDFKTAIQFLSNRFL